MRSSWLLKSLALLSVSFPLFARPPASLSPNQFVIGRDTFFDFGPPFDYFEIFSITAAQKGSRVDRVMITPPGDPCIQPAKVEEKTVTISESVSDLLEGVNPCTIPNKELRRERKRCKHCLVFSGMNVTMRIACGSEHRQIRMDILDRDLYAPRAARTPEHTSWTMRLLDRLGKALGPGPMQKRIFDLSEGPTPVPQPSKTLRELAAGRFDGLFPGSTNKVSELYREAQHPPPPPAVDLVSSEPFRPVSYKLPNYPVIARLAHVSGRVRFTAEVMPDGHLTDLKFLDGNPLLQKPIATTISRWLYPAKAAGQRIDSTIGFTMNCIATK